MKNPLFLYRFIIAFVIFGLVVSGLTAFPLRTELQILSNLLVGAGGDFTPANHSGLTYWILTVREGLEHTYSHYPFIAYGTDWLAFGHIVIAMFFLLPFREPVRYAGVLWVGVAACILVVPLAAFCGPVRGIPFYWQLIDMSFGLGCVIPLIIAMRLTRRIESEGVEGAAKV